ncbi:unnamed protein product [Coffea canephora]|uniref:Uncharacterized protein n=1 Tax=Coffea canephora TaxID=49390 RepID=A0A068UKF8_COFCA|nr:unnamed protein product [Coffea canephora]
MLSGRGSQLRFVLIILMSMLHTRYTNALRMPVSEPEEKEWVQKVGYVRDVDGIVVRMGSPVNPPSPALIHSRWHSYHKLDGIQGM